MTSPTIIVIGHGRSAEEAAKEVVLQGGKAILIIPGTKRSCNLRAPSGIETICGAEVERLEGSLGKFKVVLSSADEMMSVDGEVIILAPEVRSSDPGPKGVTLRHALADPPLGIANVAIVLGPNASRHDHVQAIELAIALRSRSSPPRVTIFTKEILVRGTEEIDYSHAQKMGVIFVRTSHTKISTEQETVATAHDEPSGFIVPVSPDLLVVEGIRFDAPAPFNSNEGEKMVGNISMGPASSMREGVLLCRPIERGLGGNDQALEARAAATRAIGLITKLPDRSNTSVKVDGDRCSACLTCVRVCPFRAPHINAEGKAEVTIDLCQACGCCVAACPSRAITLPNDTLAVPSSGTMLEGRP
jgi:heterodisulfide reductase subunit A